MTDIFGTGICGTRPAYQEEDRAVSGGRIIGGDPAPTGYWPWICSLQIDGNHYCGCVLIDDRWALTAAHCV